jgi:hypothetical protein
MIGGIAPRGLSPAFREENKIKLSVCLCVCVSGCLCIKIPTFDILHAYVM